MDLAAKEDALSVNEAVLDKGYMLQLVEVQQHRGAQGGNTFCSLLTTEPNYQRSTILQDQDDLYKPLPIVKQDQDVTMKSSDESSVHSMEDMIMKVCRRGGEWSQLQKFYSNLGL